MENSYFKYNKIPLGYYIYSIAYNIDSDQEIANFLLMPKKIYQETMIKKFNATFIKIRGNECALFLKTEQNVKDALDWIDSIITMNKLSGISYP